MGSVTSLSVTVRPYLDIPPAVLSQKEYPALYQPDAALLGMFLMAAGGFCVYVCVTGTQIPSYCPAMRPPSQNKKVCRSRLLSRWA